MSKSPRVHILKCWPESFRALVAGDKRHEVRKDDRGYMVGDYLLLQEFDPEGVADCDDGEWEWARPVTDSNRYTGETAWFRVTYKTPGGSWGLPADVCVLSVKACKAPKVAS